MVPSIYHAGITSHCLVNTGGNVNFLKTRSLVYVAPLPKVQVQILLEECEKLTNG